MAEICNRVCRLPRWPGRAVGPGGLSGLFINGMANGAGDRLRGRDRFSARFPYPITKSKPAASANARKSRSRVMRDMPWSMQV